MENTASVDYSTIEIPVGVRHYVFLTNRSKLFFNVSMAFVFNLDPMIDFENETGLGGIGDLALNGTEEYFSFGVGYKYDKRLGIELRYNTSRDALGDNPDWVSDYTNQLSFIIGYTIF